MAKSKFNIGDHVVSRHFGKGVVVRVADPTKADYPVEVRWIDRESNSIYAHEYYTLDGAFHTQYPDPEYDIIHAIENEEGGNEEMGQIASVITHTILQKERKRMHDEGRKFKVGDRVFSFYYGYGVVERISKTESDPYPVVVRWEQDENIAAEPNTCNYYTMDGEYYDGDSKPEYDIFLVNDKKDEGVDDNMEEELRVGDWVWLNPNEKGIITFIYPNKETCIVDSELDGEVEAVMAGLTKVEYSPINPSHYQVAGIPEAIDIMKHLMTQEQFKGFLWGNIIKYAYRYGRKGDEHDTAGKIEWYANRLKEVCAEEKKEQERE